MTTMTTLEVRRDDLHQTRLAEQPLPEPGAGETVLRVDRFGLTANNVTYGVFGDGLRYWSFYPTGEGWGRIPAWGFAEVVAGATDVLPPGARVYGYCPMGTHLVLRPGRVDADWVFDAGPHRAELPPAYNGYRRVESDPAYDREREDQQLVLRPLFFLGFLVDDWLAEQDAFGAETVVVSSASSKTSLATAFLLHRRGVGVVGLTSPANADFVGRTGVYAQVVTYDDTEALPDGPAVFADIAGDAAVRAAVHAHYGERLRHSAAIGATHRDERPSTETAALPGPAPVFFFAPDRITERMGAWGAEGLERRFADAWQPFARWCDEWLTIERSAGTAAIEAVFHDVLDGRATPDRTRVLVPGSD